MTEANERAPVAHTAGATETRPNAMLNWSVVDKVLKCPSAPHIATFSPTRPTGKNAEWEKLDGGLVTVSVSACGDHIWGCNAASEVRARPSNTPWWVASTQPELGQG